MSLDNNSPYAPPAGVPGTPPSPPPYQAPPQTPPRPAAVYVQPPVKRTKNKFWTVVWSLIPGAGQMYQGQMKKGISLMLLFAGIIAVAAFTYLAILTFLLPVIWFYSFFDALNRINMSVEELQTLPDEWMFSSRLSALEEKGKGSKTLGRLFGSRHLIIGWCIVIFSIWLFLKLLLSGGSYYSIGRLLPDGVYAVLRGITDVAPSLLIPVICIVLGIKLITGDRAPRRDEPAPKTYDEYTIPEEAPGKEEN